MLGIIKCIAHQHSKHGNVFIGFFSLVIYDEVLYRIQGIKNEMRVHLRI